MARRAFHVAVGCGAVLVAATVLPMRQSFAAGEDRSGGTSAAGHARVVEFRPSRIFQSWVDKLDLTDDQQEQLAPVVFKMFRDIEMFRQEESMTADQHVEMIRQIRIKANRQIRSFLTPAQLPRFDKLQKQLARDIEHNPGGRAYNERRQDFDPDLYPLPGPTPLSPSTGGAEAP